MQLLHLTSLVVIAFIWVAMWRVGYRWCRASGVDERASLWSLACIPPTAGLIVSVHILGLAALATGRGLVTPEPAALIFLGLTWLTHRVVPRGNGRGSLAEGITVTDSPRGGLGFWWLPLLIVAGMYTVFLVDALTRFPTGYDGLHYHLHTAVGWMHTQRMDLIFGEPYHSFPENGMIVPFLMLSAGLERLVTIAHLPKALWSAVTVFAIARRMGVGFRGSIVSACILLSIPVVAFQSVSSYIDLFGASAWLSALLALMWASHVKHPASKRNLILLAGLSAGIALGSKTTYLLLVALLGVIAISLRWIEGRPRSDASVSPGPFHAAVLFGLGALACSSFWFIRGTVQAGNPVYPLAIEIAGYRVLPGMTADEVFPRLPVLALIQPWWDYPWREFKSAGFSGYPYSVNNGLGAAYAAFVPAGLLAVLLSGRIRRQHAPSERWLLILLVLALSGPVLLLAVFHEMLRFVLPLVLVGVPVASVLIDRLIGRFERSVLVMVTVALLVTGAMAALKPAHALAGRLKDGIWNRADTYEIPRLVDELEPGSRILNLNAPALTYPLMGAGLERDVITPHQWRALRTGREITAKGLLDNGIDYIYLRLPPPGEDADDLPDALPNWLPVELMFEGRNETSPPTTASCRLYRVIRNEP